ncbi:MAG: hypothetical protein J5511_05555 [Bacilli bacterium]|nr:hypothetical protein [Bacilli bacterium]
MKNKTSTILLEIISAIASFAIGGFCFYLSYLQNWWFITIGVHFMFEGLFIFVPMGIKDEYKAMRVQGVFQVISVVIMMDYLLVMSLWNDPNNTMLYWPLAYLIFGGVALLKLFISLILHISIKKNYAPLSHAYRNNDLLSSFYLILIFELVLMNQFFPGENLNPFTFTFSDKPIWVYIIDVALNATFTIIAALLALSTDIRSKTKEELSTGAKIKHTIRWFNEHEVAMFFGLIFTVYLAILALLNAKQHWVYIVLAAFYLGTGLIRLINYLWHRKILKQVGDNKIAENRKSSFILLFNAFAYFFFSGVITFAAIFLMTTDATLGKDILLFLFIIAPFGILRFVNAIKTIRVSRRENNTYKLGVGYISLLSAFFSLLEIAAISTYFAPKVAKYIAVLFNVTILQIVVLVVCITFLVHFFRSLIINRKSKEKKSVKKEK